MNKWLKIGLFIGISVMLLAMAIGITFGVWHPMTEATCTEDGNCKLCGKTASELGIEEYYAIGHDMKHSYHKDATCEAEGYDKYQCTRCDYNEVTKIEPMGHNFELVDEVLPTCEVQGVADYICTVCEKTKQDFSSPLGHEHSGEFTEQWQGTVMQKSEKCCRCGEQFDVKTTSINQTKWVEENIELSLHSTWKENMFGRKSNITRHCDIKNISGKDIKTISVKVREARNTWFSSGGVNHTYVVNGIPSGQKRTGSVSTTNDPHEYASEILEINVEYTNGEYVKITNSDACRYANINWR